jgi:hypothetical protein
MNTSESPKRVGVPHPGVTVHTEQFRDASVRAPA